MLYHMYSWSICNSVHKNISVFDFWPILVFLGHPKSQGPILMAKSEKLSDYWFRYLKRRVLMHWMQSTISEKIKKNWQKIAFFEKMVIFGNFSGFFQKRFFAERWGFLRCIQFIKTLLLSYLNQQSDISILFFITRGTLVI